MFNAKLYVDVLTKQVKEDGRPYEMALNDFCDYLLDLFSVEAFKNDFKGLLKWQQERFQAKPHFCFLALAWMDDVTKAMEQGKWLDIFGMLYEKMYLTAGKAARTGQFFTPPAVSDLMSELVGTKKKEASSVKKDGLKVNDCAAGSGRLLLSHFIEVSKQNHSAGRPYSYIAQDSDPLACKMCALNMMIHGMNGRVICQDTLTLSTPTVEYIVNEVRYPFITPYYSVRVVSGNPAK